MRRFYDYLLSSVLLRVRELRQEAEEVKARTGKEFSFSDLVRRAVKEQRLPASDGEALRNLVYKEYKRRREEREKSHTWDRRRMRGRY